MERGTLGREGTFSNKMMASGMWGRLSNTAGALKHQVGRLAEDVLNTAETFSQQVELPPPSTPYNVNHSCGTRRIYIA